MNEFHKKLITYLRTAPPSDPKDDAYNRLSAMTDDFALKNIFFNFRKETQSGLRITEFGLDVLDLFFKSYEVQKDKSKPFTPNIILYLEEKSEKPYFYSPSKFVLFDSMLAVKLRLTDGDVNCLIDMEYWTLPMAT